jgi:hypothetical protein
MGQGIIEHVTHIFVLQNIYEERKQIRSTPPAQPAMPMLPVVFSRPHVCCGGLWSTTTILMTSSSACCLTGLCSQHTPGGYLPRPPLVLIIIIIIIIIIIHHEQPSPHRERLCFAITSCPSGTTKKNAEMSVCAEF